MEYLKIDSDTFIGYDTTAKTAEIIIKSELEDQIGAGSQLEPPTDEELLDWATLNYPGLYEMAMEMERLDELQDLVDILNGL